MYMCVHASVGVRAKAISDRLAVDFKFFFFFFECLPQLGEGTMFTDVCPFVCLLA